MLAWTNTKGQEPLANTLVPFLHTSAKVVLVFACACHALQARVSPGRSICALCAPCFTWQALAVRCERVPWPWIKVKALSRAKANEEGEKGKDMNNVRGLSRGLLLHDTGAWGTARFCDLTWAHALQTVPSLLHLAQ